MRVKQDFGGKVRGRGLLFLVMVPMGFPGGASGKEPACQRRRHKSCGFDSWVGTIPWSRKREPTPVFLPEKFHRQRSLVGYGPWGHKELDTIEHMCMHTHTHVTSNGLKHFTHINLIKHKFLKRKRGECLVYFCGEMLEGTLERRDRATTEGRKDQGKVMIL